MGWIGMNCSENMVLSDKFSLGALAELWESC